MTNREKRPKMVFRKFLEDNQKKMDDYMTHLENRRKIRAGTLDVRVRPRKSRHP